MKTTISKNLYEAIVKRVTIIDKTTLSAEEIKYMHIKPFHTIYRFDNSGLNDKIRPGEDKIEAVIHPMKTKNIWNVCNRFYLLLKHYDGIEEKLLNSR